MAHGVTSLLLGAGDRERPSLEPMFIVFTFHARANFFTSLPEKEREETQDGKEIKVMVDDGMPQLSSLHPSLPPSHIADGQCIALQNFFKSDK